MTEHLIIIPDVGQLPDAYTEIINTLPAELELRPRIAPWAGSVTTGIAAVETLLDKHELRRVVLLGTGVGAAVAVRSALAQPRRVSHLILAFPILGMDEKTAQSVSKALKFIPRFLFRHTPKGEVLKDLGAVSTAEEFAGLSTPTLIITDADDATVLPAAQRALIHGADRRTFSEHPQEFSALLSSFLREPDSGI